MKAITQIELDFILKHQDEDTKKLLLVANRDSEIDIKKVVTIIEARNKIKEKVPSWYKVAELLYPHQLSLEQCSSEATAIYKLQFIKNNSTIADLTGGLGIDSAFFAQKAASVDIFERQQLLTECYKNNFPILGLNNINIFNQEIQQNTHNFLRKKYDLIYLDPARRDGIGKKTFLLTDCEPNILELKSNLFSHTDNIILKLSPMMDISKLLQQLPEIYRLDVIAVNNECKELLAHLAKDSIIPSEEVKVVATDIKVKNGIETQRISFDFNINEELNSQIEFFSFAKNDNTVLHNNPLYIYEPNKAILKAGAFKHLSKSFNLKKVANHTHLYISNERLTDFPGKITTIIDIYEFSKKSIKEIQEKYPAASVTARNLPIDTSAIRKKLKLKESDTYHIFACSGIEGKFFIIGKR